MERGRLFDGKQAQPLDVLLEIASLDVRIRDARDQSVLKTWDWADVIVLSPPGGGLKGTLSHKADADCRLVVPEDIWAGSIAPHLKPHESLPRAPLVVMLCVASVAFLAAMLFGSSFMLDVAARFVPYSWQNTLGAYAATEMTDGKTCKGTPRAQKALSDLAQKLDAEGRTFDVSVADIPYINAISVPGRRIIVFKGLIDHAAYPDQLAGVLAHEVGHHHYNHPMRLFMQSSGGQLMLSLALGDAAVMSKAATAAHELLILKGSRDFETQADAYAAEALARNHIDARSLMTFLDVMAKVQPEGDAVPEWMNSHPITSARIEALKFEVAALKKQGPDRPAFTAAEWNDIRTICKH